MPSMEVESVRVLYDNYAYLLIDKERAVAAAVDPVDARAVYNRALELQVTITTVLTTHRHWDHAGGNTALQKLVLQREKRQLVIVGGKGDGVPGATREVAHGETVALGGLDIRALATPCHTRGHMLYLCQDALFTGDTLFVAGCGRFFNGTAKEMHHALNNVVASLPKATKIYCGHEYTVNNLRFAAHVEPESTAVQDKLSWALDKAKKNEPTVPSTVGEEMATNPFMRVGHDAVQAFAGGKADPVEVMGILRSAKDGFSSGGGHTKLVAMAWQAALCYVGQMDPAYQFVAAVGVGYIIFIGCAHLLKL